MSALAKYVPIVGWLPTYQKAYLRSDVVAGLTAAAVVIPQAMAYASIAGLPIQVGLYVALIPMAIYVLLGTSRPLSVSTTSSLALLTATALTTAVGTVDSPTDYMVPAATLAFLVGLFLVLASLFRLGFVADFISLPVLTGFKGGIGVVIFVGQLPKVLGLSIPSGSVLQTLGAIAENLDQINVPTVLLSLVMLAILLLLPRFVPRIPAPLVAVAAGIGVMALSGALFRFAGLVSTGCAVALGAGYCLDVFYRIKRRCPRLPTSRRSVAGCQSRTLCAGYGQYRR